MTTDEYKRRLEIFRNLCQGYLVEKKLEEDLEKLYPQLKNAEFSRDTFRVDLSDEYRPGDLELYQLLRENTDKVEESFKKIRARFGDQPADILWEIFVECVSQEETGKKYNLSRRQIQYAEGKWLKEILFEGQ